MRITIPRVMLAVAVILTAFVLQESVLSRIGLPGATPDLLLVVVLVLAMAAGPTSGAVMGFAAGVLIDVAPPAAGSIGQTAAIYAIAGFVAGHVPLDPGRPDLTSVGTICGLAAAVFIASALLGWLLGSPEITWSAVPWLLVTQVFYAGVLALAVVPALGVLYRGAVDEGRLV